MDEYDEMYGIEDDFEQQFADELEALAEMEHEASSNVKVSEVRQKKQTFEEALRAADAAVTHTHTAPLIQEDGEALTPKAKKQKQDVVKKLHFKAEHDDITPPSSPEARQSSGISLSLSPDDRSVPYRSVSVLDISGLAVLQESPRDVTTSCHALKRPPASGDFITITDCTGNRVYLRKTQEQDEQLPDPRFLRKSHNAMGLLAVPVEVLKEQVAERRHRQLVEESQRLTEINTGINPQVLVDENMNTADESSASRLWVDRFAPQHYTELLSDDFTNRCLLKWLKLWDSVVFGRERKPHPSPAESRANATHTQNQNQRFKTKSQITEEILEAELDQYKRPKHKVALLSGPPGLGKTTLAHIIAKHAGYNVVEINASDDRSAELFQKRIDTATQMKSVLGANEKPNCLIIDEIDGAPSAAITVLLATLNRKDSRDDDTHLLKKKKKKECVLLRPIICICNDLYTPALRPLRQQAFLLTFPPTQQTRLTQRLAEIAHKQGMKADTGSLMALCEKTDNDIRACINTLQFLHGRGQRQLDQCVVNSMSIGLKDQNKGLFSAWQEIFQLPRMKRKRIGGDLLGGFEEAGLKDGSQRLQHILHLSSSTGEHEKLAQGLYDNFLSMKLKDPSLAGVCSGLDWLCFSDLVNQCVLHGQNYSLMRYLPFLPAAFHYLFAANSVPRIIYPNSHYEGLMKTQHAKNALVAMLAEIPPSVRSRVCQNNLCLDILSLLLDLICPKLRPVNPQLYSTREKQQLCELIDTMINYNLTYRQERTPEGQYTYVLEPNVEDVVRFPGLPPRRQLTYQVKQLIARETELERMRRMERAQHKHNPQNTETVEVKEVNKRQGKKPTIRNHQQRLENIVRQTVVDSKPETDFFGRAVAHKLKAAASSSADVDGKLSVGARIGKAVGNSDVWFRFNEGVSNAVRRNVHITELL